MFKTEDGRTVSSFYKKDGGYIEIIPIQTKEKVDISGMSMDEIMEKYGTLFPKPKVTTEYKFKVISRLEYYKGLAGEKWNYEGGKELVGGIAKLTFSLLSVGLTAYAASKAVESSKRKPVIVCDEQGNPVDIMYVKI